jgi:hypothetical protein
MEREYHGEIVGFKRNSQAASSLGTGTSEAGDFVK